MPNQWKNRETSPDRTVVWTEPLNNRFKYTIKVPVVYYLSSNGQLQQPHFIEVPLSTPDGLYLRDVINRLNFLRGEGMANRYSWSCKRSYKSGYVWNDLAENDFIHPAIGHEYVLKGSELPEDTLLSESNNTIATQSGGDVDIPAIRRRRHQSFDMHEYKAFTDASTQTDDTRRRRRAVHVVKEEEDEEEEEEEEKVNELQEIIPIKDEIPPPMSDSSPETLGKLMKADRRLMLSTATGTGTEKSKGSSSVFMQLLTCGATWSSIDDCVPVLNSNYKPRLLPRVVQSNLVEKGAKNVMVESSSSRKVVKVAVEDNKQYFTGSLVETNKAEAPASSS